MGKTSKVVVCGMKGVGKTAILEQLIYGNVNLKSCFYPTIEDIYVANIETDRGTKERVCFYDTAGLEPPLTGELKGFNFNVVIPCCISIRLMLFSCTLERYLQITK